MSEKNNITPNEADLKLAQSIEQLNQGIISSDEIKDPLFPLLEQFKIESQEHLADHQKRARSSWIHIEKQLDEKAVSIHQMPDRSNVRVWAVAASILILAFAGIFWYSSQNRMQLLGQTGSEMATLNLKDGSMVTLRPNSELWLKKYSADEHQYQLNGEALFEVSSNSARSFQVETGDARVTVLGTRFIMKNWGETGSVYLEEGSVRFENLESTSAVVLKAGESSRIKNGKVSEPQSGLGEVYKDWLDNIIVLDGQTTADLFAEMEQHFNIQLSSQADIYSDTLGGSIELTELDQALEDLSVILGGSFQKTGDTAYRFSLMD